MKSSLNVLSVCLCLFPAMIQAATLTVDNKPGAVAQYTNLKNAVDAAREGDTILIAASNIEYVGDGEGNYLTIYKRVHLVGPGYLLAENSIPGVDPRTAVVTNLNFINEEFVGDATGSSLTGLQLHTLYTSQIGNQGYPQITIDRCNVSGVGIHNGTIRRSLGNFSVYGAGTAAVNCIGYVNVYEGAAASHCTLFSISTQAGCSISNSIFAAGLPSSPPHGGEFPRLHPGCRHL